MKLRREWFVVLSAFFVCAFGPGVVAQDITADVMADDGTLLSTDVYLPEGDGPWPVALSRTPYGKRRDDFLEACSSATAAGYACVVQDWRSFGQSGAQGEYWWNDDGVDGRVTVDWIAEQSWCDGNVGTFGISASTETQFRLVPGAGSALKAIAAAVSTADMYHALFQDGVLREAEFFGWLAAVGREEVAEDLLQHRLLDEFWDAMIPLTQASEVTVPGLHVGGWFDIGSQNTIDAFTAYQNGGGEGARGQQKLIVGPWTHSLGGNFAGHLIFPGNTDIGVNLITTELDERGLAWLDYWLKGDVNGVDVWPPVLIYLMGAAWSPLGIPENPSAPGNVWVALESWPPPVDPQILFLGSGESLVLDHSPVGELELFIDPDDPVPTRGGGNNVIPGGPRDQREIEARDDVFVFTTEMLSEPLTVMGRISCTLWIRPDTTDLDLAVRLTDVYPSGHSMLVTDGIQRARMRCSDEYECFLTPGEPTEITVDLWSTALVFNRGHKIRISVSGSNWPRFEVNPNHGGDLNSEVPGVIARPDLLFGPDYPSRLELPIWTPPPRDPSGRAGETLGR